MDWLLPDTALVVGAVHVSHHRLDVQAHSTAFPVDCPGCGLPRSQRQGHYLRSPHDLACGPYSVRLRLRVRRFYCHNPECDRTTFAEGFPHLLERHAQRTTRLHTWHAQVGLSLGGEAGAALLHHLGGSVSPDTLLNSVKALELPARPTPRVLGVDDFAFKRGRRYGTVLVDLERRWVVDVLPDREAATLAAWLKEHPGVNIVTRDRLKAYQQGIAEGAPEATQVADRWHLLHNVTDAVKGWLERHRPLLLEPPASEAAPSKTALEREMCPTGSSSSPGRSHRHEHTLEVRHQSRERRLKDFEQVLTLKRQGLPPREIAAQVASSLATVYRWFKLETFPERKARLGNLTEHLPYLHTRLEAGCTNVTQLHRELIARGYSGSSETVSAGVLLLHKGQTAPQLQPPPARYSVRDGVHLMITPPGQLSTLERSRLEHLCATWPEAKAGYALAQDVQTLFRSGTVESLQRWLTQAEGSGIREFQRLARGIRHDQQAVEASLSLPWSSGQAPWGAVLAKTTVKWRVRSTDSNSSNANTTVERASSCCAAG